MGNIEITTKFFRLKSVSSIDDDYSDYSFNSAICFRLSLSIINKNNDFSVKKMFIDNRLCNQMTYVFKGHLKIVTIYMVKFNVSILKRRKIKVFWQIESIFIKVMSF